MENFEERNQNRLREKSVYLLHLDTPRIIIISCVLIGILITAFLVGMNFNDGEENQNRSLAQNAMFFNPIPGENISSNTPFENPTIQPSVGNENAIIPQENDNKNTAAVVTPDKAASVDVQNNQNESRDVLNQENIKEIIPPAHTIKKKKKPSIAKKKTKRRTRANAIQRKKRNRSNRTVEVVSRTRRYNRTERSGYSIQIGAFDTRAKAKREVRNLERHRYDPYIVSTRISGRNYYRVRIGPITSKQRAIRLLNEIQDMSRYEDSYLIR